MRQYMAAMKIALRVLTAVMEQQDPDSSDIEELRRFAPECADRSLDSLACEVIHKALEKAKARRLALMLCMAN